MKLTNFRIKGFKSIIDSGECKISDKDNVTVLAGQNEAGKSAILEALEFFKNGPGTDFVRLQKRLDSKTTEVICKFLLIDEDLIKIKEGFNDKRIDDFFNTTREIEIKRSWTEVEGGTPEDKISIEDSYFKNLVINDQENTQTTELPHASITTRDAIVKALTKNILDNLPIITLYRYFTDFLPSDISIQNISTNSAVKDFETVFNVNLTQIANISDPRQMETATKNLEDKATDDFNKSWSQKLSLSDDSKYKYVIRVLQQDPKKIVFMIKGTDENPLYLEQKSVGFRWFSAFHLRLRALGADKNTIQNLILLVDEPGQNLHETAQLDAKKVLEELSNKGVQIIYSTHNAKLIGTQGKEFTRIRLVSNSRELGTKVETISQFASKKDQGSLDALAPIITAMGIDSIGSFVDKNRLNVIVEGITDHYYLSAFKKLLNKDEKFCFIPAVGVNNVPNVVSVLLGWGYNFKAVFDDDKDAGRKAYNLLKKELYENSDEVTHQNIYKIKDCNGIEDIFSSDNFHQYVLTEQPNSSKSSKNSELAKGKKEILARQFLEKVNGAESVNLDAESLKKINAIFDWLYKRFGLQK